MKSSSSHLLSGNIAKAVITLAGPMFVSAILQNAQSLIDLFWVGSLGPDAVAALTLSGVVLMAMFPVQMGLATGTVALVSRAYGAGDVRRASQQAGQSLTLSLIVAVILGVIFLPLLVPIATLLGAEPDVVVQAVKYLRASLIGMSSGMLLFIASSSLQASGNTTVPMMALLFANIFNMLLDPLFIFGLGPIPGFGVAGAAWATVLANLLAAAGLIWMLTRGRLQIQLEIPDFMPYLRDSIRLLQIGLPSMAQMMSRSMMGLVFYKVIARFGTEVTAGYGIGMRWHMVLLMPCFVFGNATATLVGQNLGAGQPLRARRTTWVSVALVEMVVLITVISVWIFSHQFVAVFNNTPKVVEVGSEFLRIVTPFYLMAGVSIVCDRALNGAGCTIATMIFTIISLWLVQVPLALLFSGQLTFLASGGWWIVENIPIIKAILVKEWFSPAFHGVWWAMGAANATNMVLTVSWFSTGRWMNKKL
ncbi:MAG: MATE family efflux transporter [Lentisphaerae bacterium]|nr:MATE family efflux transporter [Lentisphaerota bacterium]